MRLNASGLYTCRVLEQPNLVEQYCAKGNQIGVVPGHLVSRSYVNKQEQHVYVIELAVEELYFVEGKENRKQSDAPAQKPGFWGFLIGTGDFSIISENSKRM